MDFLIIMFSAIVIGVVRLRKIIYESETITVKEDGSFNVPQEMIQIGDNFELYRDPNAFRRFIIDFGLGERR